MADYLVYWKPSTVAQDEALPTIRHSASDQYRKLKPGDVLWIVTSEGPDDLVLVGRQRVDRIVGQLEAERVTATPDLWKADFHAVCDEPSHKANLDISRWARKLTFEGTVEDLPPGFTGQHLQTMRRLDGGSVALLEKLWARCEEAD